MCCRKQVLKCNDSSGLFPYLTKNHAVVVSVPTLLVLPGTGSLSLGDGSGGERLKIVVHSQLSFFPTYCIPPRCKLLFFSFASLSSFC